MVRAKGRHLRTWSQVSGMVRSTSKGGGANKCDLAAMMIVVGRTGHPLDGGGLRIGCDFLITVCDMVAADRRSGRFYASRRSYGSDAQRLLLIGR